jgi:hypothetical protein
MSEKCSHNQLPQSGWKNESARQRWELFHRAIAHAKQTNLNAMAEADAVAATPRRRRATLTVAK